MASEKNITLYVNEIMYDISNKAYLTGRSKGDASAKAVHDMQVTENPNIAKPVVRFVLEAYSSLKGVMAEWVTVTGAVVADNTPLVSNSLDVTINVPDNFHDSMLKGVADSMHSYIVDKALADWFSITNKEDAELYANKATNDIAKLKEALFKRKRPIRTS
ncbi:MAG: hypothetical protein IJ197_08775 [Bacteroidaceae bacterium]|nr:hypothetical protein [Bacteroidaceae bacterium]